MKHTQYTDLNELNELNVLPYDSSELLSSPQSPTDGMDLVLGRGLRLPYTFGDVSSLNDIAQSE